MSRGLCIPGARLPHAGGVAGTTASTFVPPNVGVSWVVWMSLRAACYAPLPVVPPPYIFCVGYWLEMIENIDAVVIYTSFRKDMIELESFWDGAN